MCLAVLFFLLVSQAATGDVAERFNRAVELHRKGDLAAAETEYRAVLSAAPQYAQAHANLGALLMRLDRYQEALQEYKAALRLDPKLKPVLLNIGIAHFRRSEYESAIDSFKRFLQVSPKHAQATQLTALALVELGRDEEALTYLEPALEAAPNDPALLYALGLASLRLRKPMVSGVIKTLAELPGGLAVSYLLQGQANLANFQFEKAIEDLEQSAKLNPNLPRLHYSLGVAYFKVTRYEDSRIALQTALKRAPNDVSGLCYLASIDEKEGKLDDARRRLNRALLLEPASADANWLLGKVLLAQGKAAEALKPLEAAASGDPNDTQKRYQLARAYQQLGRKEDAERELAEVERIHARQRETDRSKIIKP